MTPLRRLLILIVLGTATLAGCAGGPGGFADRDRSWAPAPAEVTMPAKAPDDPAAYRGARFRAVYAAGPGSIESGGEAVPWLRGLGGGYGHYGHADGAGVYGFGNYQVHDGRRHMLWFIALVERPLRVENPGLPPPGPQMAVLDVLAVNDGPPELGRFAWGCGPGGDEVIIIGDNGWRLNRSTGRTEPIDPDKAECTDED